MSEQIFEKTCIDCRLSKPLAEFERKPKKSGHLSRCRPCMGIRRERKKTLPKARAGHRRCARCFDEFPLAEFPRGSSGTNGYRYCRKCRSDYFHDNQDRDTARNRQYVETQRQQDWAKYKYPHLKYQAKRRAIPLEFSQAEFCVWHAAQEETCDYCKLTFEQLRRLDIYVSIDRLDNNKGYSLDNIALACLCCNKIKLDVLTVDDMREIAPTIRRRLLVRLAAQAEEVEAALAA